MWAPELSPATVVLDAAPADSSQARSFDVSKLGEIIADREMDDGRHIVVADKGGDHRIWLRDTGKGQRLAFVIATDGSFPLRLAMAQRFERRMRGLHGGPLPSGCRPTTLQRGKLTLLINLLDAEHAHASRREMAALLVYPGIPPLRGAEWKGSNERRRTQRLLEEARRLMAGAYRSLLGGG